MANSLRVGFELSQEEQNSFDQCIENWQTDEFRRIVTVSVRSSSRYFVRLGRHSDLTEPSVQISCIRDGSGEIIFTQHDLMKIVRLMTDHQEQQPYTRAPNKLLEASTHLQRRTITRSVEFQLYAAITSLKDPPASGNGPMPIYPWNMLKEALKKCLAVRRLDSTPLDPGSLQDEAIPSTSTSVISNSPQIHTEEEVQVIAFGSEGPLPSLTSHPPHER